MQENIFDFMAFAAARYIGNIGKNKLICFENTQSETKIKVVFRKYFTGFR